MTFLLLQISDTHLGADWADAGGPQPGPRLRRAVEAVLEMADRPDALVVTGDLTENGAPEEYAEVRNLLEPLGLEPHVIPGNHDVRGPLREAFGLPGSGDEPVGYSVDLGPLRLVALDSTIVDGEAGALDEGRLEWLDAELAAAARAPTVLAMHHPPLSTSIPALDDVALARGAREGLAEVLERHPQVTRIIAGHVHRAIACELAGRPVVTTPSTYLQAELVFGADRLEMRDQPPGFAIHALAEDGTLTSHLQTYDRNA